MLFQIGVVIYIVLTLSALYCLFKAHKHAAKARKPNKERDQGFEAVTFHCYQGYKLPLSYAFAIILAPWRMLVGAWVGLSIILAQFFCIGADHSKEMPEWRKKCIKFSLFFCCYMATRFHLFMFVNETEVDADYSEYLGPDWKKELKEYKKIIPTIVTNHSSFLDIWLLLASKYMPAFLARTETKTSFVGKQADGL